MTRLNLLDALTSFTNEVMRETLLPVRRQKGDEEEPAERPPLVYRQRLPDVKSATSKAPYILHQIVTGEDEQKPGEPTDSSVEVRSLFCVYGEDDQEGALRLLTTVEHFRQELLMHGIIAKQFALDLSQKLSTLYYTDNRAQPGVTYTYRVIPVHAELLDNGILLEGTQSVQVARVEKPSALSRWFSGLFAPKPEEKQEEELPASIFAP